MLVILSQKVDSESSYTDELFVALGTKLDL